MRRSTRGSYTLEAALILPVLILAMLTMGYFIKVEGTWENVINGVGDELHVAAMKGYDGISGTPSGTSLKKRVMEENPDLDELSISRSFLGNGLEEGVHAYRIRAGISLAMPMGLGRDHKLEAGLKYRSFIGKRSDGTGMGREALRTDADARPVVIFPQMGERYHSASCTYVKASVEKTVLTGELKRKYGACGLCDSGKLPDGSIVFCYGNDGTAYHRGSCRSINRQTVTVDRSEAIEKGYTPCSKCGGG